MTAASLWLHVGFFYREIELLGRNGSLYAASEQLPIYRADNRLQISRLREIIIDFYTDAMDCGFKSGVRRQEDCHKDYAERFSIPAVILVGDLTCASLRWNPKQTE